MKVFSVHSCKRDEVVVQGACAAAATRGEV